VGIGNLGRDWRRLFDLWLAAEIGDPIRGRRSDVARVFFAGPADDAGFHRHHAAGLLADETGLLNASSGNFTTKEQRNEVGAKYLVAWLLGCSTKKPEACCLASGFEFLLTRTNG
jgi:hypothetical protein